MGTPEIRIKKYVIAIGPINPMTPEPVSAPTIPIPHHSKASPK
jgi:hypothetical protein